MLTPTIRLQLIDDKRERREDHFCDFTVEKIPLLPILQHAAAAYSGLRLVALDLGVQTSNFLLRIGELNGPCLSFIVEGLNILIDSNGARCLQMLDSSL